jgi:hypothetical protein
LLLPPVVFLLLPLLRPLLLQVAWLNAEVIAAEMLALVQVGAGKVALLYHLLPNNV